MVVAVYHIIQTNRLPAWTRHSAFWLYLASNSKTSTERLKWITNIKRHYFCSACCTLALQLFLVIAQITEMFMLKLSFDTKVGSRSYSPFCKTESCRSPFCKGVCPLFLSGRSSRVGACANWNKLTGRSFNGTPSRKSSPETQPITARPGRNLSPNFTRRHRLKTKPRWNLPVWTGFNRLRVSCLRGEKRGGAGTQPLYHPAGKLLE